jgi:hypothetical protein
MGCVTYPGSHLLRSRDFFLVAAKKANVSVPN